MGVRKQSSLRQGAMGKCVEQKAVVQILQTDSVLVFGCPAD